MSAQPPSLSLEVGALQESASLAARRRAARRLALSLTGACAVLVALSFLVQGLVGAPEPERRRSSYGAAAGGFRGLFEVARRLGLEVSRHHTSLAKLPPPEGATLVIVDPFPRDTLAVQDATRVDAPQLRALRGWLERGGRLVLALPGRTTVEVGGYELDVTGAAADPWLAEELLEAVPATAATPLTGRVAGVGPLAGVESALAALTDGEARLTPAHLTRDDAGAALLTAFTDPGALEPVAELEGQPLVLRGRVGAGEVWLAASSYPFTNLGLARSGFGPLALALLDAASDGGRRGLHFDEYLHGMPERRGLGRWVVGTTLRYPVLAVLLLALVLAWRGAVPARPPAAARTVPRRAKEEFVLSLADIKLRAGRHRAAARALIEAHRARLEAGAADEEDSAALTRLAARVERAEPFGEAELRTVANEARALGRAREEART